MKPLKLIVQAFGPFSKVEEIAFDKLGQNPLFLINGPTGAGKSSILDAICFALYGQTTGAERSASQMRCDFAELTLLTEVTLDFALGDKQYRITRIPMQERAKAVGEGTTTQNAKASLWLLDGTENNKLLVPSSVNKADAEIKSLIGLDVEQFRQVMVLPQGKFRELLLADSKDREKIFSQLFQTSIYKKIEDALKAQASDIRKAVEQHQSKIKGILEGAEVNSEEEVTNGLSEIEPELTAALAEKTQAETAFKASQKSLDEATALLQQFANLEQKRQALTHHKDQQENIEHNKSKITLAANSQKIQPLFTAKSEADKRVNEISKQLSSSQESLIKSTEQLTKATTDFDVAAQAHKNVEPLQQQLAQCQQSLNIATDLTQASIVASNCDNQAKISQQQLATQQKYIEDFKVKVTAQENLITEQNNQIANLANEQIKLDQLRHGLSQRQELAKQQEQLNQLSQQFSHGEHALIAAENTLATQLYSAKQVELSWHTNQAAILASELTPGAPCPVCGSVEHPNVAGHSHNEQVTTKDMVDHARELVAQATNQRDQAKSIFDTQQAQQQFQLTQVNQLTANIGALAQTPLVEVQAEFEQQTIKVKGLLAIQEQLIYSQENLVKGQSKLTQASESIAKLELAARADNEKLIQANSKISQLQSLLPESTSVQSTPNKGASKGIEQTNKILVEQLNSDIAQLSTDITNLNDKLQHTRQSKDRAQSSFDQAKANQQTLAEQLSKDQVQQTNCHTTWLSALAQSAFANENDFTNAILSEAQLQQLTTNVEQYKSTLDSLTAVIAQFELELKDNVKPELSDIEMTLTQALHQAQQVLTDKDKCWRTLDARKNQLLSVQDKLDQAHQKNEELETQYKTVGTLYEVSNGLTGDKVSLQRFVLSVLLDDVLIQASQRLLVMSKSRYQLIRKEERAKGNKASGLELEVDDAYTGKSRPVATLSGGESFMAALSLALGLSDVVQSYAGGIKLDTLFIDEGFGSLDPESLDLAIRTLIDLQSTGRMIGIISHVEQLKSQMALRVDVKTGNAGSEISTVAL